MQPDTAGWLRLAAVRLAESAVEQGFPRYVDDPTVLAKIAAIIRSSRNEVQEAEEEAA